ncbi:MAG: hypothetical protein AB1657_00765 [Candidatus Micrarchaeota archaeon]
MNGCGQIQGKELLRVQVQGQPRNLVVLRAGGSTRLFDAHPLVDGFNAEHGTKLTVVSHKVADAALTVGETWRSLPAFVVDASIAFEKPGIKLGDEIVFSVEGNPRVVQATGRYKGEQDVALVGQGLTSADIAYTINGKQRTLQELLRANGIEYLLALDLNAVSEIQLLTANDRLIMVPNFPPSTGRYMPHAETGIPHGRQTEGKGSRHLWRPDGSGAGLVARGDNWDGYVDRQYVNADYVASNRLGVVAEVPQGDAAKIEALISKPPAVKTDEKAVIEVPGVSIAKLSELYQGATGAVERMSGVVDEQLAAPLREFLAAIGKARF